MYYPEGTSPATFIGSDSSFNWYPDWMQELDNYIEEHGSLEKYFST